MTNKNEMPELKPCPFCGCGDFVQIEELEEGSWYIGCVAVMEGGCGFTSEFSTKEYAIKYWNTRADLVKERSDEPHQPPVIEGLEEAIAICERSVFYGPDENDSHEIVLRAASLYAQGQTAQPVDLDALKQEVMISCVGYGNSGNPDTKAMWRCVDYLASRGMIVSQDSFDNLVEMLEREPQHKPRLAALLRKHSVIDDQPSEDAQRALDWINEQIETAKEIGLKSVPVYETIRAALAQKVGE